MDGMNQKLLTRDQLKVIRTLLQLASIFRYQNTVLKMPHEDQLRILALWKDLDNICTLTREQVKAKLNVPDQILTIWNEDGYLMPLPPSFGDQEQYISADVEIIELLERKRQWN